MTTAHRPTFYQALGGENQSGNVSMAPTTVKRDRDMPQELTMKMRAPQQEKTRAEMIEELERKEFGEDLAGARPAPRIKSGSSSSAAPGGSLLDSKSSFDAGKDVKEKDNSKFAQLPLIEEENPFPEDADADFGSGAESEPKNKDSDADSDEDSEDSDYEALQRELAKIKQEKEDEKKKKEEEEAKEKQAEADQATNKANPLLNANQSLKRRWDEDTVFRNQARTEPKQKRRYVNDNIRSEFHRRFLNRYVQ